MSEVELQWDCEKPRTREGYYRVQGGIHARSDSCTALPHHRAPSTAPVALAFSHSVPPLLPLRCQHLPCVGLSSYCDVLWMETKAPVLSDAAAFASAVHSVYPDAMLAYNLSPSSTGRPWRLHHPEPAGGAGSARLLLALHHPGRLPPRRTRDRALCSQLRSGARPGIRQRRAKRGAETESAHAYSPAVEWGRPHRPGSALSHRWRRVHTGYGARQHRAAVHARARSGAHSTRTAAAALCFSSPQRTRRGRGFDQGQARLEGTRTVSGEGGVLALRRSVMCCAMLGCVVSCCQTMGTEKSIRRGVETGSDEAMAAHCPQGPPLPHFVCNLLHMMCHVWHTLLPRALSLPIVVGSHLCSDRLAVELLLLSPLAGATAATAAFVTSTSLRQTWCMYRHKHEGCQPRPDIVSLDAVVIAIRDPACALTQPNASHSSFTVHIGATASRIPYKASVL